jgi:uncharacterized protein YjbJ (UPF0337 family)
MKDRDLTRRGIDDSTEGKINDVKGKVKDAAGGLTGDSSLQAEGKMDQFKGKVQDTLGKAERSVGRELDKHDRDPDLDRDEEI